MPKRRRAAALVGLSLLAAAAACGESQERGADSAGAPVAAQPSAPTPRPTGAGPAATCPHDGRWRPCSVAERLEQSGLAPRPDTGAAIAVPFLTGRDTTIRVGRGRVLAFVYDDTARLAREVAALDTGFVVPRGGRFAWPEPPTFVRSANLVAVVLVGNERQLERVQLALQAGPPQPNPDRP